MVTILHFVDCCFTFLSWYLFTVPLPCPLPLSLRHFLPFLPPLLYTPHLAPTPGWRHWECGLWRNWSTWQTHSLKSSQKLRTSASVYSYTVFPGGWYVWRVENLMSEYKDFNHFLTIHPTTSTTLHFLTSHQTTHLSPPSTLLFHAIPKKRFLIQALLSAHTQGKERDGVCDGGNMEGDCCLTQSAQCPCLEPTFWWVLFKYHVSISSASTYWYRLLLVLLSASSKVGSVQ